MSLIADIAASYRRPRRVVREQLARGIGEEQILFYGLLFCFLTFLARLPSLAQEAHLGGAEGPSLAALASNHFVASVFFAPLFLYGLAALSHLALRLFRGQGSWRGARLALFWAALTTAPLVLLAGASSIFLSPAVRTGIGIITGGFFLWLWFSCLHEVEFRTNEG